MEKLRCAQFFQQAGGKTVEERFKLNRQRRRLGWQGVREFQRGRGFSRDSRDEPIRSFAIASDLNS
ncbi:hypothetical protein [Polyangium sp. 15x6]|uniref:hypothetical protein n=1 Tax=Polyangium sp. 15x6 TaxID=3042687 RepID=UPI002499B134|nr:hypothetical protein [Polyangium sp. 15x6]MDI3285312.1 hypothetical protein [Polyangium sp. 15x6]